MCKKLVITSYAEVTEGELSFNGKRYAYFINTKKQLKKNDFICIADPSGNEDRNLLTVVRIREIVDYKKDTDETEELIQNCIRAPRDKIFVGKADLADYFAEIDKRNKIADINAKLEKRFKEAEKEALYRKLAETDPVMKGLLEELEALK